MHSHTSIHVCLYNYIHTTPSWGRREEEYGKVNDPFPNPLYSMFFLYVRPLIQPFLPFTTSTLLATWHTFALVDLFHRMSWKMWPILFLHLSGGRCFACSTTLLAPLISLLNLLLHGKSNVSPSCFELMPRSQEARPLSSNLIDMNESSWLVNVSWSLSEDRR